jgi:hypothetical protein
MLSLDVSQINWRTTVARQSPEDIRLLSDVQAQLIVDGSSSGDA